MSIISEKRDLKLTLKDGPDYFEIDDDYNFTDKEKFFVKLVPNSGLLLDMLCAHEQVVPNILTEETSTADHHEATVTEPIPTSNANFCVDRDTSRIVLKAGVCFAREMNSDSDNLFAAVTHQLENSEPYTNAHLEAIKRARKEVSEYIHRNKDDFCHDIIPHCESSYLYDQSSPPHQKISEYLEKLKKGEESGGIEIMSAIASYFSAKIIIYEEKGKTLVVNPEGSKVIKLVQREPLFEDMRPTYDSFIRLECNTNLGLSRSNSDTEDYSDIREYFDLKEWKGLSKTEKDRYRTIKDRYQFMESIGQPIKPPKFMEQKSAKTKRSRESTEPEANRAKKPTEHTRTSLRKICPEAAAGIEESFNSADLEEPTRAGPSTSATSKGSSATDNRIKNATRSSHVQQNQEVVNRHLLLQDGPRMTDGRIKPPKETRKIGTVIPYPSPLPKFTDAALQELNAPAHLRKMHPINLECKAFLRKLTKTEYLEKQEYDNFCKTLVEKYPKMKGGCSKCPHKVSKDSLGASFRAERKNIRKKQKEFEKAQAALTAQAETEDSGDQVSSDESDGAEGIDTRVETALDQLRNPSCTSKTRIKELIKETNDSRFIACIGKGPLEIVEEYKYLKIPEMMLYDYTIKQNLNIETMEENVNQMMQIVGTYYEMKHETEHEKLLVLMKIHEYFLSAQVKKGAKAVITVSDEKQGEPALVSSPIQAPFLTVLTKIDFFTGNVLVSSATLIVKDKLISTLKKPSVDKIILLLLASYFTLYLEYPAPYMQFMRAIERFVTGKIAPSKYGNTKAMLLRFLSQFGIRL